MFGQYDQVLAGSAGRIGASAPNRLGEQVPECCSRGYGSRPVDGFAVSVRCIGGAVWLGDEWAVVALGGAGAANLVGRFVGKRS